MSKLARDGCTVPGFKPDGQEWRAVRGHEGRYEVSESGQVRSLPRVETVNHSDRTFTRRRHGRILSPTTSSGYRAYLLTRNNRSSLRRAHVLVADAFIGARPDGLVINHIDQDRLNNHYTNLEYVTQAENMRQHKAAQKRRRHFDTIKRKEGNSP